MVKSRDPWLEKGFPAPTPSADPGMGLGLTLGSWDGRGMDDAPQLRASCRAKGGSPDAASHPRVLPASHPGFAVGRSTRGAHGKRCPLQLVLRDAPGAQMWDTSPGSYHSKHHTHPDNNKQPCLHQRIFSSYSKLEIPGGARTPQPA